MFVAPTGLSYAQIERGARCDVIFALPGAATDEAARNKIIHADTVRRVLRNDLVLIGAAPAATPPGGDTLADIGRLIAGKTLAIANPERDAAGARAVLLLRKIGIAVGDGNKAVVVAESSAGVVSMLAANKAWHGIVHATDAMTRFRARGGAADIGPAADRLCGGAGPRSRDGHTALYRLSAVRRGEGGVQRGGAAIDRRERRSNRRERREATVTDITAGRLQRVSKVIVHPLTVRITHWLNALAIIIMIMSGWRIYNSDPILPFYFPVEITLGGSYDGSVDIHNEDGLAGALQWHFAGMWLLTINGIVYLAYGILSGHFRRAFLPVGPSAVLRDTIAALKFQLPHKLGVYNAVQKTLYLGVLAAGVIMVLSGLAIWKPGQFQELTWAFGGFDVARVIHFLGMVAIVLFLIVHVALVVIVPKTLPAMITGRARSDESHSRD